MGVSFLYRLFSGLVLQKAGLTREDAARDAMRSFDVEERLITVCIRELLEVCSFVLNLSFLYFLESELHPIWT